MIEDGSYEMKLLLSPSPSPGRMHYFSDQANHYLTYRNQNSVKSWDLETLEVIFERSLSVEDKKERGCSLAVEDGIIFLRDNSLPDGTTCGWAVNGKRISNKVAERLAPSALDPPRWDRTTIYLRSRDRSPYLARYSDGRIVPLGSGRRCGTLYDRFLFTISLDIDSTRECTCWGMDIHTKEGEWINSTRLAIQENYTWFIDILGQLVIMYQDADGHMEEWEMIDFRGVQT